MRLLTLALVLAASTLITVPASADVGPVAPCGAGTHHEYFYGHKCVPNGSHLERDPAGGVKTVRDKAADGPATTAPPATEFASPPPSASAAPAADSASVPVAPPASRGCACGVAEVGGGAAGILAAVAGLAALRRRRRQR